MATTQIKDGFAGGSDNQLKVNPDGSINVTGGGGGGGDVNIFDSAGNPLTSTSGALNVNTSGTSEVTGDVTSNVAGLTSFQTSQYTVGTSAVQLAPTPLANRSSLSVTIIATVNVPVYIGNNSSVTTSTGYPLFNGSTMQLDLTTAGQIWAISTVAGQSAAILEIA
jgi:hypothetical protein